MRFVKQRNDWDLVIPFKEDCFDSKLHNGTKFEKLTHRFLFAFQDSGDCESVPSYCFASSKDLTKVYYPLKYNELVVAYLEIKASDSGVAMYLSLVDITRLFLLLHFRLSSFNEFLDDISTNSTCIFCS